MAALLPGGGAPDVSHTAASIFVPKRWELDELRPRDASLFRGRAIAASTKID